MSALDSDGVCPSCAAPGRVGEACAERICALRGYHFIPAAEAALLGDLRQVDPMIGRRIDEYLLVGLLGQGGFGSVYLALQLPVGLRTALKRVDPARVGAVSGRLEASLEKEARALAALSHPNIVRLLRLGAHEGAPYLVTELVEGGRTLRDALQADALRGEPMPLREARDVLFQVFDAIEEAHRLGIVHRDLKPENLLLQRVTGRSPVVRVADFGLARTLAETHSRSSTALGTPHYMAPEQIDRGRIGPFTDVYALGVLAFELLFGRMPFQGETASEILANKLSPSFDPTACLADLDVAPAVLVALRRVLAQDSAHRTQTVGELRKTLGGILDILAEARRAASSSSDAALAETGALEAATPGTASASNGFQSAASGPTTGSPLASRRSPELAATGSEGDAPPRAARTRSRLATGLGLLGLGSAVGLGLWGTEAPESPPRPAPARPSAVPLPPPKIDWVALPAGRLEVRVPEGEVATAPRPALPVAAFELMRTEVTIAQYRQCVAAGACVPPGRTAKDGPGYLYDRPGYDENPVAEVTWNDAWRFCTFIDARLPDEVEWEYAARGAGKAREYPWGDAAPTCERAVLPDGNFDGCGAGTSATVCSKPAGNSAQGICDLAGNVREWCADCDSEGPVRAPDPRADTRMPSTLCERVVRGGGFRSDADALSAARRDHTAQHWPEPDLGIRCARTVSEPAAEP